MKGKEEIQKEESESEGEKSDLEAEAGKMIKIEEVESIKLEIPAKEAVAPSEDIDSSSESE